MAAMELAEQLPPNTEMPQEQPYQLPLEYNAVADDFDAYIHSYTEDEIAAGARVAKSIAKFVGVGTAIGITSTTLALLKMNAYGTKVSLGPATCQAYTDFSGYGKISAYNTENPERKLALLAQPVSIMDGNIGADVECPDEDLPFTITPTGIQFRKGIKDIDAAMAPFDHVEKYAETGSTRIKDKLGENSIEISLLMSGLVLTAQLLKDKERSSRQLTSKAIRLALAATVLCTAASSSKAYATDQLASPPGENLSSVYPDFPVPNLRVGGVLMQYMQNVSRYFVEATDELHKDAEKGGLLLPNKDTFNIIFTGGEHCQTPGNDFTAALKDEAKAQAVFNGGDLVMSGAEWEEYCLSSYRNALGDIPIIMSPGNHESEVSERQAKALGFQILNDHLLRVKGLWVIGDDSPRTSSLGRGSGQKRNQTESEMGDAVGQTSCFSPGKPAIMNNEPHATEAALKYQCASLGLAVAEQGFYKVVNGTPYLTVGGAGGVVPNTITLGDIRSDKYPAERDIIQFTKPTKYSGPIPLAFQRVFLFPGAHNKVRFGNIQFMPGSYTTGGELTLGS